VSLWHIYLTQNQIVNQITIFLSAALGDLFTVPVSLNFFSSLLVFVHVLFENSF